LGSRLARSLANRFGGDLVFKDAQDIGGPQRWRAAIRAAIEGAEVVVAIGLWWLSDRAGPRRLDDADDVRRAELVEPLELKESLPYFGRARAEAGLFRSPAKPRRDSERAGGCLITRPPR